MTERYYIYSGSGWTVHPRMLGNRTKFGKPLYRYDEAVASGIDTPGIIRIRQDEQDREVWEARSAASRERLRDAFTARERLRDAFTVRTRETEAEETRSREVRSLAQWGHTTIAAYLREGWIRARPEHYGGDTAYIKGHTLRRGHRIAISRSAWKEASRIVITGLVPHATMGGPHGSRWDVWRLDQTVALGAELRVVGR